MEERKWPTPLGPDGTAPVLLTLLGSSDLLLARQAAYLIYAGKALKESGYEIEAFPGRVNLRETAWFCN